MRWTVQDVKTCSRHTLHMAAALLLFTKANYQPLLFTTNICDIQPHCHQRQFYRQRSGISIAVATGKSREEEVHEGHFKN